MNPIERSCWKTCPACLRCEDKGTKSQCAHCSGRRDPKLIKDPHDIDDKCRCTEGILQYRLQTGKLIKTNYPHDPFQGTVYSKETSQDERDWDAYLYKQRELLGDENWNPVQFTSKGK